MSEAVGFVFAEEIDKLAEKKIKETEEKFVSNLLRMDEPIERIVEACEWTTDQVMSFAKSLGYKNLRLQ